jgi:signal transduction histidine kinase
MSTTVADRSRDESPTTSTEPLGWFSSFLGSPNWVVVGAMLLALSGVFVLEMSTFAARSLEPDVLRRETFVALPSHLAMLGGVVLLVVLLGRRTTTTTRVAGVVASHMKPFVFLIGIALGLGAMEASDRWISDVNVRTLSDSFTMPTLAVVLVLHVTTEFLVFVLAAYVSVSHQTNRQLRQIAGRNSREIGELNALLVDSHRSSMREIAGYLHGEMQGRLLRLIRLMGARSSDPGASEIVDELSDISDSIVRPLSHRLYPAEITVSLGAALQNLSGAAGAVYEPTERFESLTSVLSADPVPLSTRETVYYVAREALNNTVKHGAGGTVLLSADAENGWIILCVTNESPGPDGDPTGGTHTSFGLRRIDADVASSGGTWSLRRDGGTVRFTARIGIASGG